MLKALTVKQPFGTLIVRGDKPVENRNWETRHRGLLAITTSKAPADEESWEFCQGILKRRLDPKDFPRGAIVGVVKLASIVQRSRSPWFVGDYGFVMQEPVEFAKPIPCRGQLNVWTLSEELEKLVRARL